MHARQVYLDRAAPAAVSRIGVQDDVETGALTFDALTADDRVQIAGRLERELQELRTALQAEVPGDVSDRFATRRRAETQLRQVAAALRRLSAGGYAECVLCGGDIERRRLLANPSTPYCRHCEEDGL
jgi:RNA polymerase-binding transcription factor DksA